MSPLWAMMLIISIHSFQFSEALRTMLTLAVVEDGEDIIDSQLIEDTEDGTFQITRQLRSKPGS